MINVCLISDIIHLSTFVCNLFSEGIEVLFQKSLEPLSLKVLDVYDSILLE